MAICRLSKQARVKLQTLIDNYDTAWSSLILFLLDMQSDWLSEINERSEKWKKSAAGQSAQERLNTLDAWLNKLPDDAPTDIDAFK
jgi:hypothetical protein